MSLLCLSLGALARAHHNFSLSYSSVVPSGSGEACCASTRGYTWGVRSSVDWVPDVLQYCAALNKGLFGRENSICSAYDTVWIPQF